MHGGETHHYRSVPGWKKIHRATSDAMTSTDNTLSYELGRRLGYQGPHQVPVGNQAGLCDMYWKKKTKKHKKKAVPSTEQKPNTDLNFNILQANVCGINNKRLELAELLNRCKVHIALFQETQHTNSDPHITGYTSYCCKCENCRGIITYIRNDVQGEVTSIPTCQPTDIQKTSVWYGNQKLTVFNVYSPPGDSFTFPETEVLFNKTIIAGDFNGHSPLWGYTDYNETGKNIEELCLTTNLVLLQDKNSTPTLLHRAHGTMHRPDLTMVSGDIQNLCNEKVLEDISSDHRPILTTLSINKQQCGKRRTRWNFKKADWGKYRNITEETFDTKPYDEMDIELLNETITSTILEAATHSIPRGCTKNYKPFWNDKLEKAVQSRRMARSTYESDPTPENKTLYNKTTAEVKLLTKDLKKEHWTDTCESLNLQQGGREAWNLLNNMSGEKRKTNPKPLHTEPETLITDHKKAEHFNRFFASVNKANKKTNLDRGLHTVLVEKEHTETGDNIFDEPLTLSELEKALKKLKKRKSPGPDKVHNEMLLNLGPKGKAALLYLFNKTWNEGKLPKTWKTATITPILKKGKRADHPQSYRPISLTSCIGKLGERIVNQRLYWWLEASGLITQNQAGFRAKSRTEDQLFRLTQGILDGFQKQEQTTAVFIDLQQAYDRVWRKGLFLKMQNLGIKGKLYKWIKSFLTNRLIQTQLNSSLSSKAVLEEGLPQGSSLSCTLFLIFLNDISDILKSEKALFADDLVLWYTCKSPIISQRRLNEDLRNLQVYCNLWKLKINNSKTVYTIFTRSPKIAKKDLKLSIDNIALQKDENPVYLGIQLDRQLSLNTHITNVKSKATKRMNLVKRLASTTWGSDKNLLRNLYLGYARAVIDYNIALQNICSDTTKKTLDTVQNHALRFICGGMRSTPTAACEIQANVEPLELRRKKAALQIYERSKRMEENHPCRQLVDEWKPQHRLKQTSVLHRVEKLKKDHHLPENRQSCDRVPKTLPPSLLMKQADIKMKLIDNSNKKTAPSTLKMSTLETIDSYPKDWIHTYTDGSAFKATINAGYGAITYYPDGEKTEILNSCGSFCSNYVAEQLAITNALTHINNTFGKDPQTITNIVVFTDSLSTLQALESGTDVNKEMTQLAWTLHHLISNHNIKVVLQWIPGHAGISGNETADNLAKRGASLPQSENPVSLETASQMIKSNLKEEWLNSWATNTTGRALYAHMNRPNTKDPLNNLKRGDQTTIFRLRTRHVPLNSHLNRIKADHPASCPLCNYHQETVDHHLLHCKELKDLRDRFLPSPPTISNCLYGTKTQLKQTSTYYNMASGRRARAQQPLVQ